MSGLSGRLVVASHNAGKVRELAALLGPFGVVPISAAELGLESPEETEATFAGNAVLKAEAAANASGLPALADDSGLEVMALGGAPGIFSARWAPDGDFRVAMERVWRELNGTSDLRARFVCALALKRPGEKAEVFEGYATGTLVWPPRGTHGFGYDPMFAPDGFDRTFGEMAAEEKQPLTHRARAFEKLVASLR